MSKSPYTLPDLRKGSVFVSLDYSIKPQIVEIGFVEDLKDGLHKD